MLNKNNNETEKCNSGLGLPPPTHTLIFNYIYIYIFMLLNQYGVSTCMLRNFHFKDTTFFFALKPNKFKGLV